MGNTKLVGYKIKKSLKAGDIIGSVAGLYEEIYEPKQPLEELADLAQSYSHLINDPDLSNRIEELVKQIRASHEN